MSSNGPDGEGAPRFACPRGGMRLRDAHGYTRELLDLFARGATAAGGIAEVIHLAQRDVRPCTGCFQCWNPSRDGRCAQRDDMAALIEVFQESEAVVFATPVYYYSFSAILKAFLERLLATSLPAIDTTGPLGLERNTLREEGRGPQLAALIAVGAHRSPEIMDGLVRSFRLICDGIYARPAGMLLRPESFFLDFDAGKPITGRRVRLAFESAGRELVLDRAFSRKTERDAALPFTRDLESFARHSGTYWTIAREIGAGGSDRDRMRAAASTDLRILIHELAACLDPVAAGDLEATIHLHLDDRADRSWSLLVSKGRCAASPGPPDRAPDLTLSMAEKTLVEVILQRLDVRSALADGIIVAAGSRRLLSRFGRLFPPPAR